MHVSSSALVGTIDPEELALTFFLVLASVLETTEWTAMDRF